MTKKTRTLEHRLVELAKRGLVVDAHERTIDRTASLANGYTGRYEMVYTLNYVGAHGRSFLGCYSTLIELANAAENL